MEDQANHKISLETIEEQSAYESDFNDTPPSDIIAYNELRSCADIYRMHEQGVLMIQPHFQRDAVWRGPDQTRFLDSLIKRLPIPSMCFSMDHKTEEWMVIDGLQRISTIIKFLGKDNWRLSTLKDIDPDLSGKPTSLFKDTKSNLHKYYRRVENLTIPITVIRCDYDKESHMEYLFTIFHRLNTGGAKLNNQEIRNCIYSGRFNNLLKELDDYPAWRKLNKMHKDEVYRFRKQEQILRFFAFTDMLNKYSGHLTKFINDYMAANRKIDEVALNSKKEHFKRTVDFVVGQIFNDKRIPKLSVTFLESLLIGVGNNLSNISSLSNADISARYQKMQDHPEFTEQSLAEGLSKREKVKTRLNTAIQIFAEK